MRKLLRAFRRDRSASVAMIFAISIIPASMAVGISVDYGRAIDTKVALQNAADAAALYAATAIQEGVSDSTIEAHVRGLLSVAWGEDTGDLDIDIDHDDDEGTTTITVAGSVDTSLLTLLGVDTLDVAVTSTTINGTDRLEIALVLDNTGSMASNGKLDALKAAAVEMIEKLEETEAAEQDKAYVSVVPFSVPVKVGVENVGASWLGDPQYQTTCTGRGRSRTCTTTELTWTGCVGDRPSPNTALAGTPTSSAYRYPRYYGTCNIAKLTPLTNNLETAKEAIDDMIASGNTNIPVGIVWGWNMLTPDAPLSTSVESTPTDTVARYMVVLTDGDNTQNTLSSSSYTIDTLTEDACENVKADGVTVFTIRVIDGDEDLLSDCATSGSYYYDVSNTDALDEAFDLILKNITKLRIQS